MRYITLSNLPSPGTEDNGKVPIVVNGRIVWTDTISGKLQIRADTAENLDTVVLGYDAETGAREIAYDTTNGVFRVADAEGTPGGIFGDVGIGVLLPEGWEPRRAILARGVYDDEQATTLIELLDGGNGYFGGRFGFSAGYYVFSGRQSEVAPWVTVKLSMPEASSELFFPDGRQAATIETRQGNGELTNGAVQTLLKSIPIPAGTTRGVHGFVVARRIGGTSGTAEDGAFYEVKFAAKGNAGNNAALIGSAMVTAIGESQAAWDVAVVMSGGNAQIKVTGAANNTVSWWWSDHNYYDRN